MMNLESPLYSGFVRPDLCQQLQSFGVTPNTPYHYRITAGSAELNTFAFDPDDVYAQAFANLRYTHPVGIIPAYSLKEIERALPDYLLSKVNGSYELTVELEYRLEAVTEKRLPDAFAHMLILGIRARVFSPAAVSELITQMS